MRNVFVGVFLALVAHDILNIVVQLLLTLHRYANMTGKTDANTAAHCSLLSFDDDVMFPVIAEVVGVGEAPDIRF